LQTRHWRIKAAAPHPFIFFLDYSTNTLRPSSLLTKAYIKMAPRKPTANADTSKKKPVNETNRVVKRPARGYSKYKNGFLNVTPTDKEMEM
jgi:hypothetical protein